MLAGRAEGAVERDRVEVLVNAAMRGRHKRACTLRSKAPVDNGLYALVRLAVGSPLSFPACWHNSPQYVGDPLSEQDKKYLGIIWELADKVRAKL